MTQSKRRPSLSPERVLQRDLMDAFWGFRPRRSRMVEPQLEAIEIEVVVPKLEPAVTNTTEDVVATIDRVESIPKVDRSDLRPRHHVDVTNNAARQARWRSKQDVAALRLQAKERMKILRAKRKARTP